MKNYSQQRTQQLWEAWPQHLGLLQSYRGPSSCQIGQSIRQEDSSTQRTAEDTEEETGFMCYSSITRYFILTNTLETKLSANFTNSDITPRAYAGGRHPTFLPTDMILDTGSYCSIVHNRSLLINLKSCKPIIFDGLSGSVSIRQKESLGSICDAYDHKDCIANMLSVSAINDTP